MHVGAPTPAERKRPLPSPQLGWVEVRRRGKLLFEYHPGLNWIRIRHRGVTHLIKLDMWLEN